MLHPGQRSLRLSVSDLFEYVLRNCDDSDMVGITISKEENEQDKAIGILAIMFSAFVNMSVNGSIHETTCNDLKRLRTPWNVFRMEESLCSHRSLTCLSREFTTPALETTSPWVDWTHQSCLVVSVSSQIHLFTKKHIYLNINLVVSSSFKSFRVVWNRSKSFQVVWNRSKSFQVVPSRFKYTTIDRHIYKSWTHYRQVFSREREGNINGVQDKLRI
jgi:hypothetical protein